MNKKGYKKRIIIDDSEDLEIKKIANSKPFYQKFLFYVLTFLFCIMLIISVLFVKKFCDYDKKDNNVETIEINNKKNNILITNNGEINIEINKDSFKNKEDLLIEKISSIELTKNNKKSEILYDIKFDVLENEFNRNDFSTLESDVLVKFSYSYDLENWKYINNVISTSESTITPLMGNNYDISGIKSILNVVSNNEINVKKEKKLKIYWRCELVFKYNKLKDTKKFKGDFRIEYKNK